MALRILTLVEWGVRERLRVSQEKLDEIYVGQRGRKTSRPSAELLLRAMKTIRISVVEVDGGVYVLLSHDRGAETVAGFMGIAGGSV